VAVADVSEQVRQQLLDGARLREQVAAELVDSITAAAERLTACLRGGHKLLLCGNGGSAADAQHIAAELVGRYTRERPAWPAIALTTDTSALTAIGNDYGYERTFDRQVEALGRQGDALIAISTSGNSPNVLAAVVRGRAQGLYTLGFAGRDGGRLAAACDLCLTIPHDETARIQEMHITLGHILCDLIEAALTE